MKRHNNIGWSWTAIVATAVLAGIVFIVAQVRSLNKAHSTVSSFTSNRTAAERTHRLQSESPTPTEGPSPTATPILPDWALSLPVGPRYEDYQHGLELSLAEAVSYLSAVVEFSVIELGPPRLNTTNGSFPEAPPPAEGDRLRITVPVVLSADHIFMNRCEHLTEGELDGFVVEQSSASVDEQGVRPILLAKWPTFHIGERGLIFLMSCGPNYGHNGSFTPRTKQYIIDFAGNHAGHYEPASYVYLLKFEGDKAYNRIAGLMIDQDPMPVPDLESQVMNYAENPLPTPTSP